MNRMILFIKRLKIILNCPDASLVKSLYYNFKYLSKKNFLILPMVIGKKTRIIGSGKISINDINNRSNINIYIGCKALKWIDEKNISTCIVVDGILEMGTNIFIGRGSNIEIEQGARLILGDNFNATGLTKIICHNLIEFGNDNLISWDTLFMDSDAHTIVNNKGLKNKVGKITFGNHNWICSRASILKDTYISNNTVISCNSVVTGRFERNGIIIGGNKGSIIKEEIEWSIESPHTKL